jgi:hypothetical protein
VKRKKPTKAQIVKQLREEILAKYPHLKYVKLFRSPEGYPHLIFSTPADDDFDLSLEIASRLNEIQHETGHFVLAGVYTEEDLGVNKD